MQDPQTVADFICRHRRNRPDGALAFRMRRKGARASIMCLPCAVRDRALLRRSILTALVVGTLLAAINHGTEFANGDLSGALAWQVPLTYLVPFCVATWGALTNAAFRSARDVVSGAPDPPDSALETRPDSD